MASIIRRTNVFFLVSLIGSIVFFAAIAEAATLQDGIAAAQRGDYVSARQIWQDLADKGDHKAQYNLALLYTEGNGVEKNPETAARWMKAAADGGFPRAQVFLATVYFNGVGLPKNDSEGLRQLKQAASQSYAPAMVNLGVVYAEGSHAPKDSKESVRYFRMAAILGDPDGQHNLGVAYFRGEGAPKNLIKAYVWFKMADTPRSASAIGRMVEHMSDSEVAEARALAEKCKASNFKACGE